MLNGHIKGSFYHCNTAPAADIYAYTIYAYTGNVYCLSLVHETRHSKPIGSPLRCMLL